MVSTKIAYMHYIYTYTQKHILCIHCCTSTSTTSTLKIGVSTLLMIRIILNSKLLLLHLVVFYFCFDHVYLMWMHNKYDYFLLVHRYKVLLKDSSKPRTRDLSISRRLPLLGYASWDISVITFSFICVMILFLFHI